MISSFPRLLATLAIIASHATPVTPLSQKQLISNPIRMLQADADIDDLDLNVSDECKIELFTVTLQLLTNICSDLFNCDEDARSTALKVSNCKDAGGQGFTFEVSESCTSPDMVTEVGGLVTCAGNSCTTEEYQAVFEEELTGESVTLAVLEALGCSVTVTSGAFSPGAIISVIAGLMLSVTILLN